MYLSNGANLDYWSTDNCCSMWSLRTGTIIIGFLTMLSQALLATVGIMAAISCPLSSNITEETLLENVLLLQEDTMEEDILKKLCESNAAIEDEVNSNVTVVVCPLVPGPELESFGISDVNTFLLIVGIFVTYCCVYFILSACVVVGALWRTPRLVRGWVAFTTLHMVVVLADLLCTLAHTTLAHLCTSIALFVIVLYTWAVVRSYLLTLNFEKKQTSINKNGDTTDYTVDGVDIEETPVQV